MTFITAVEWNSRIGLTADATPDTITLIFFPVELEIMVYTDRMHPIES